MGVRQRDGEAAVWSSSGPSVQTRESGWRQLVDQFEGFFLGLGLASRLSLRLLNALNNEDRGLKAFDRESAQNVSNTIVAREKRTFRPLSSLFSAFSSLKVPEELQSHFNPGDPHPHTPLTPTRF